MNDKYLVVYSPSCNGYAMICIGGDPERILMQQWINAIGLDDGIIMEVTQEKYNEIFDSIEMKFRLF